MATRGRIGVLRPDGRVESIYNHYDSYPEGLGNVLAKDFLDPKLIDELISLGDRRSLYHKGEKRWTGEEYPDFRDKSYLYTDDKDKYPSRFNANEDEYWDNDDDLDIDYKYLYVPSETGGDWYRSGKRTLFATYKKPTDVVENIVPQPVIITNPQAGLTGGDGKVKFGGK